MLSIYTININKMKKTKKTGIYSGVTTIAQAIKKSHAAKSLWEKEKTKS